MAKTPAGKEPGTRQCGGEELALAERWVWGGDSKMSPRDRGVQEQSLDVRGGEEKERKGQKGAVRSPGVSGQQDRKGRSLGRRPRRWSEPWEPCQSTVGQTHSHQALTVQPPLARSHVSRALHMICILLT